MATVLRSVGRVRHKLSPPCSCTPTPMGRVRVHSERNVYNCIRLYTGCIEPAAGLPWDPAGPVHANMRPPRPAPGAMALCERAVNDHARAGLAWTLGRQGPNGPHLPVELVPLLARRRTAHAKEKEAASAGEWPGKAPPGWPLGWPSQRSAPADSRVGHPQLRPALEAAALPIRRGLSFARRA